MTTLYGTVAQVLSGDTILLVGVPRGGPPPERQLSLSCIYAPKLAIRTKTYSSPDQPFSFRSREYLRQMLIGKPVKYTVDYELNGKIFGTVRLDQDQDVSLLMVEAGLARVTNASKRVSPQGNPSAEHWAALLQAEEKAKQKKIGLWTENETERHQAVRDIEWLVNDSSATKSFVEANKLQELPGIVEAVINPVQYRVYFPEKKVYASVTLSGLSSDGIRAIYDPNTDQRINVDPLALEGKYFSSSRVLNRDLKVRIEGSDDFGNIYGTFIHPKGNISLLLLQNGFTKINERSVNFVDAPAQLRQAQRDAQKNQLRRWQNYTGAFQDDETIQQEYFARVIEVVSGDSLILSKLPCPNNSLYTEHRVYLASIRCPRPATRNRPGEPWGFEAKEFVRKKLIGKRVKVLVCYVKKPVRGNDETRALPPASDNLGRMHFVSITLENGKMNIAEFLVSKGLATVLQDRGEDALAQNYDVLRSLADQAMSNKLGIHSLHPPPKHHLNDLCGVSNASVAKQFLESFKRLKSLEGVVEQVINACRFRIRIPSESVMVTFVLAGIRSPDMGRSTTARHTEENELANEAWHYTVLHYLQRNVEIVVETCARGGAFLGVASSGGVCINVDLVKQGYAKLLPRNLNTIQKELKEAEQHAKNLNLGVWLLPDDSEEEEEDTDGKLNPIHSDIHASDYQASLEAQNKRLSQVTVVQCSSVNDFFLQIYPSDPLEELQTRINEFVTSRKHSMTPINESKLKVGKIVLCQFSEDMMWYRARVLRFYPKSQEVSVIYTDYGNSETRQIKHIISCPEEFSVAAIPSFAYPCSLAGLKPPTDFESEGLQALIRLTSKKIFRCVIEKELSEGMRKYSVYLFRLSSPQDTEEDKVTYSNPSTVSLNEELVALGFAQVDKKKTSLLTTELLTAEAKARQLRVNMWTHGDVGDLVSDEE